MMSKMISLKNGDWNMVSLPAAETNVGSQSVTCIKLEKLKMQI